MKILTCYLAPSSGSAQIAGIEVQQDPLAVREKIGYLPESTPLYLDMTVLEFLEFAASMRHVPYDRRYHSIRNTAEVCGLFEVMAKPIGTLSKGYRQRVGLAQALIHDPQVLILDEPTSGLDPNQIIEIRELIKQVGQEKTIILSTHILSEVQATCGRVIIINEGQLVADGAPDQLAAGLTGASCHLVVDAGDSTFEQLEDKLRAIKGVAEVTEVDGENGALGVIVRTEGEEDPRRALFSCVKDNQWVLLELHRKTASLEDVFRRMTTE
jgi:ABC-2 type transport system ATP-binding protein